MAPARPSTTSCRRCWRRSPASAARASWRASPRSWSEPLILWQALVGGPSHGKTPALDALRRPLAAVEKTTAPEKRGPVVIDQDTALPALLAAARKRPAGALLWRDEPAAWLSALGCNGRGEARQLSALLDSWSPLRTALGPGSPAISIIGCLDPARLDAALSGSDDGRAARFLYAWPKPAPYRSFLELPGCRESEAVNALQRIARIAGDPAQPLVVALGRAGARRLGQPSRPLARRAAALRRRRSRLARQGPRYGGAAGVGAGAARLGGEPLARRAPAPRHHGRARCPRPAASGTISVPTPVRSWPAPSRRTASA